MYRKIANTSQIRAPYPNIDLQNLERVSLSPPSKLHNSAENLYDIYNTGKKLKNPMFILRTYQETIRIKKYHTPVIWKRISLFLNQWKNSAVITVCQIKKII